MIDLAELQAAAADLLEAAAYDYVVGGAGDEITVVENERAWSELRLRPHVLRDVRSVSTEVTLFGRTLSTPVLIAPMGYQRLAHERGELAMAEGAAASGAAMVVSTMATVSMEDVAAAAPGAPRWFQLYVHSDRDLTDSLVRRATAAGYEALVFTVDVPVPALRKRDERNRFDLPTGMRPANLDVAYGGGEGSILQEHGSTFERALTPDHIGRLHEVSGLPIVVKGVLRGDDADAAVRAGAAGIIVSNHGGRQLDTAMPTALALPEVAAAVDRRVPVLVDGGIRRGTDIVKAVALGASAVLVGRPFLWALAVDAAAGVSALLDDLTDELRRSMALCGVVSAGDMTEDLVVGPA